MPWRATPALEPADRGIEGADTVTRHRLPTLTTQLARGFVALVVMMLVLALLAVAHLRAVHATVNHMASEEWPRMLALHEIATHAQGHGAAMARLLTATRSQRESLYPALDAESAAMNRLTVELLRRTTETEALSLVRELDAARRRYREVFANVGEWIERGELARAGAVFATEGQPTLDRLVGLAGQLAQAQQRTIAAAHQRATARVARAETQLALITLMSLAASAVVASRVGRGVARPMANLGDTARRLAEGDLRARAGAVAHAGPSEVARVGEALDAMAEALLERNARIERIAFTDPTTDLPNRSGVLRQVRQGARAGAPAPDTVLLFDVARLAAVNDVLGPTAGDGLLHTLGCRLQSLAAACGWHVAHLGAGTFAVLWRASPAALDAEVELVRKAAMVSLSAPVARESVHLDVEFRCGWSRVGAGPFDALDLGRTVREAEEALAEAKRQRVVLRRFEPIEPHRRRRQLVLLSSLKQAAATGGLEMWLQPKVAFSGEMISKCHGFEALVRWHHSEWGVVAPAEFVPFAEAAGMIGVISRCMIEQALRFLTEHGAAARGLDVSVNVSTADLLDEQFAAWLSDRAQQLGAPLERLILEITETRLMDDAERALPAMNALRAAGVRWSVDDFGTGYSSLAYLQRLPVSELKIDRAFVDHVDVSPQRRALLHSIVQLGHGLGLQVTAEGIERMEEWTELMSTGCDLAQGWLVARPMPLAAALEWLNGTELAAAVRPARVAASIA